MNTATETTLFNELPSIEKLEQLASCQDMWCVSIYMPTNRAGKEVRQDPIRLKNLVSEAETQLEEAGVEEGDIKSLLKPARDLCNLDSDGNREFWAHQGDGLAILLRKGSHELHSLQVPVDELTIVAHRHHVKPLLRAVESDQEYCVLAVSQGNVRFLEGSRSGLHERTVEELPDSLKEVVNGDHHKGFNLHSFKVRSDAGNNAVPHGHIDSDHLHELRTYFRAINEALKDVLKKDNQPLVFAGVTELFPYFEEQMEYDNCVKEPIHGNPDELSTEELHKKAWPLVEERLKQREEEAVERWNSVAHSELAETCLKEIIPAAHEGRVDTLIVKQDSQIWGTYDVDQRKVDIAEEATAENFDLLDLAVIKTLQADGRVIVLEKVSLPDYVPAGAIYRY
ncbi:MAG: hypothetical protein R3C11_13290 [Planctomycetaceae bacterium]